jgi:hypothetical protein
MWWILCTNSCAKMLGAETYPLKADPNHFDPFKALGEIRAKAGKNAHLTEIEVEYVRSDGTMNLNATYTPAPRVTYTFEVPLDKAPADAPPVGAGSTGPGSVWMQKVEIEVYEPGQGRSVTKTSGNSRVQYTYHNEGMDIERRTPRMEDIKDDIGDPKISAADLWKIALQKGAPKDAVATIDYRKSGFRFDITGVNIFFNCDHDGKLNP